jgi:hypothetical protein
VFFWQKVFEKRKQAGAHTLPKQFAFRTAPPNTKRPQVWRATPTPPFPRHHRLR